MLPNPWFWTLAVTVIILLPVMAAAVLQLIRRPDELNLKSHVAEVWSSVRSVLIQFVFGLAVLPYEALRYTDAILLTHWRMVITKQKMLEWTPSGSVAKRAKNNMWNDYRTMWFGFT